MSAVRTSLALACVIGLSACQTRSGSGDYYPPKGQSLALADGMHPDIRREFLQDYVHAIVKGTSAAGMERACVGRVRVRPQYRQSLQLTLRSNDLEFGAGISRVEIAKKVAEHRRLSDCAELADGLNAGGYSNFFLERLR